MRGFKKIFRPKRTKAAVTPAARESTAAVAAPEVEEDVQNDPPPYSPPPTAPNSEGTGSPVGVLDPSLMLTASAMEQRWVERDRLFARVVVQFIAERFDGNLRGWAGYKYTYISNVRPLALPYFLLSYSPIFSPFCSFAVGGVTYAVGRESTAQGKFMG
jgi:hypothetical protein